MLSYLLKSKKIKYGSAAVVISIIFIVIILLINGILTAIDSRYGLYADFTSEQRYEIGDSSRTLLSDLSEEIEIIFCRDRDKLIEDSYNSMIVTLAEKYDLEFKNISVKFIDRARNPQEINRFRRSTSDAISDTDVLINAKKSGNYRKLTKSSFFTVDQSGRYVGFNGEMRLTSTIVSVTRSAEDKVVIVTGHDETVSTTLVEVLMNAGYDTEKTLLTVNLSTGDIPENTRLVIINNPKRDFLGYSAEKNGNVNEISKLDKYLKAYGNLFVAIDSETSELPELCEYLNQQWGISFKSGRVVRDTPAHSISTDGKSIIATLNRNQGDVYAYEVTRRVSTVSAPTIASAATPLELRTASGRTVAPILLSSNESVVLEDTNTVATGQQVLMAISSFLEYPDGQNEKYSHVIVSGSTDFTFTDMQLGTTANADLMYSILSIAGTEKLPIEIDTKLFSDTSITGMGIKTARSTTVALSLIPTLIVLLAGIAVYIKRRSL